MVPYIVFNATWMQQTIGGGGAAADAPPAEGALLPQLPPGRGPVAGAVLQTRRPPWPAQDWWGNHVHEEFAPVVGEGMVLRQPGRRCRHAGWWSPKEKFHRSGAGTGSAAAVACAFPAWAAAAAAVDGGVRLTTWAARSLRVASGPPSRLGQGRLGLAAIEEWSGRRRPSFFAGHRRRRRLVATDYVPFSGVCRAAGRNGGRGACPKSENLDALRRQAR